MAKKSLPQLDFDSSGSASVRFFGLITELGIHYANAKLGMLKMVCPKSINTSFHCGPCESGTLPNPRNLAIGWDCRMNRWAVYLATISTFQEIFKQCKAAGATGQMMSDGTGPDIILQRIGSNTEVVVMPETIGQKRGEVRTFDPTKVLNDVAGDSCYAKFESVAEVEAAYPKVQVSAGFSGYQGFSPSGISGYSNIPSVSGSMGFSGVYGVSGSPGVYGTAPRANMFERLELLRDARTPKIEVMAEPEAVKARPKIKDSEEVKEMRSSEDRWDLLG